MSLIGDVEGVALAATPPRWLRIARVAIPALAFALLLITVAVTGLLLRHTRTQRDQLVAAVTAETVAPDARGRRKALTLDQALAAVPAIARARDAAKVALVQQVVTYRAATARAQVADLTHARVVETRNAMINKEQTDALSRQLADARGAADAYARRLRGSGTPAAAPGTDPGRGGAAGVPGAPDTTSGVARAGGASVVAARDQADARAEAAAVIKAEGWQAWWRRVSTSPP